MMARTKSGDWRDWLTARPIAHRGLHDGNKAVIENSLAAAKAAMARNFAIECDVVLSRDDQVIVFHDFTLDRLTPGSGSVAEKTAAEIAALGFSGANGCPPTLEQFLATLEGQVPLVIELKSDFSGNTDLAVNTARIASQSGARVALKSFDPDMMAFLRAQQTPLGIDHIPLGMVAEARYDHTDYAKLRPDQRTALEQFLHWDRTRPDFLSWHVGDLPHATPNLMRTALNVPVMTWTVRTQEQKNTAMRWADQIVFEQTQGLKID